MDSMRSLNTSLPKTRRPKPTPQPDLHQTFRTAALTVTNLYKSALADLDNARSEGYQEALEDLLSFLDKENIGVGDGEGWRIRTWATERFDGVPQAHTTSDSEDELIEEKRARSSSPVMERIPSLEETRTSEPPHAESTLRSDSAPPPIQEEPSSDPNITPPQGMFHFTSSHAYPSNSNNDLAGPDFTAAGRRAFNSTRRNSTRSSRNMQRAAAANLFSLGNGAGQKRKLMQDFFNIDGFNNDRRDGTGGGGKRGRLS